MIYIVCFALSAFLAYLANKTNDRKRFWLFSIASVAVMVLLAGLRDYSVGTDTINYLNKKELWAGAVKSDSLFEYMDLYLSLGYREPLFALLIGVVEQVTGEFRVLLFVSHLIILTGIYVGVFRNKKYINPPFVLLAFYLLFFNHSLNIMRQYIAIAIVFAFLADIEEKKYWRYCLAVVVATLFHTTAILSLGILILHFALYYQHDKINILMHTRKTIIACGLFVCVLFFTPALRFLQEIGAFGNRYAFFLRDEAVSPALIVFALVACEIWAADFFKDSMRKKCEKYDFYFMCSVVYLISLQLTYSIGYGRRISLYFACSDLITLGLIESSQTDVKKRRIVRGTILAILFIYWVYSYVLTKGSETVPYVFCI